MKAFLLALFLLVGSSCAINWPDVRANINEYVDILLKSAKDYMQKHGLDPLPLSDVVRSFSAVDLAGVKWHGELILNEGSAQDLSTIYRSGDVLLDYVNKTMYLTAEMGFNDLLFNYNFSAKIMDIGPTGLIYGQATDVILQLKVEVDLLNKTAQLDDFHIKSVGQEQVQVKGLGTVLDWMVNGITKAVLSLFNGPIMEKVEEVIRGALEEAIANIDIGNYIPNFV